MKSNEYFMPSVSLWMRPLRWAILIVFVFSVFIFIAAIRGEYPSVRAKLKKIPGITYLVKQREMAMMQSKLLTLGFNTPGLGGLADYIRDGKDLSVEELKRYQKYYLQVVNANPLIPEAHGLLGLIHTLLKQPQVAIVYYKNAVYLKPDFFWFNYNLGLICFDIEDFQDAYVYFKRATENSPVEALKFIYNSRVYYQIFAANNDGRRFSAEESLKTGYRNAYFLLSISYKKITGKDLDVPKEKIYLDDVQSTSITVTPKIL